MNNVIKFPPPATTAPSEASVNGPFTPPHVTVELAGWRNSDYPLSPASRPKLTPAQPRTAPVVIQQTEVTQHPLSPFKRAVTTVGILLSSVGLVGGICSSIGIGPIGLAIGAGAFVVGVALILLATRKAK